MSKQRVCDVCGGYIQTDQTYMSVVLLKAGNVASGFDTGMYLAGMDICSLKCLNPELVDKTLHKILDKEKEVSKNAN